jgi:hypothetical protein
MIERHHGELGEGFDREIAVGYQQRGTSRAEVLTSPPCRRFPPRRSRRANPQEEALAQRRA